MRAIDMSIIFFLVNPIKQNVNVEIFKDTLNGNPDENSIG
jgi:hypothetical protein